MNPWDSIHWHLSKTWVLSSAFQDPNKKKKQRAKNAAMRGRTEDDSVQSIVCFFLQAASAQRSKAAHCLVPALSNKGERTIM
jgi:hypothetical protein